MKAIILAGGFATRLWPLTEKTAKPLLEIAGKPMLSYLIEKLPADIPIVISTNAVFANDFDEVVNSSFKREIFRFYRRFTCEEGKKGALAAVSLVLEKYGKDEDILVLAGDNLFFFDISQFLKVAKENPLLAAFDIKDLEEAKKFGVIVPDQISGNREQETKQQKTITEFQEKPEHPKSTLVSTGCLYFPKRLLGELMEYSEKNNDNLGGVFEHFLKIGEIVEYFDFQEEWFDVGSFSAFLEAQKFMLGEGIKNSGAITAGKNMFSGSIYLAKNSVVEDSLLEDVIIQEGAVIRNASVRNSVIGKNAVVTGVDISGVALREESFVGRE